MIELLTFPTVYLPPPPGPLPFYYIVAIYTTICSNYSHFLFLPRTDYHPPLQCLYFALTIPACSIHCLLFPAPYSAYMPVAVLFWDHHPIPLTPLAFAMLWALHTFFRFIWAGLPAVLVICPRQFPPVIVQLSGCLTFCSPDIHGLTRLPYFVHPILIHGHLDLFYYHWTAVTLPTTRLDTFHSDSVQTVNHCW